MCLRSRLRMLEIAAHAQNFNIVKSYYLHWLICPSCNASHSTRVHFMRFVFPFDWMKNISNRNRITVYLQAPQTCTRVRKVQVLSEGKSKANKIKMKKKKHKRQQKWIILRNCIGAAVCRLVASRIACISFSFRIQLKIGGQINRLWCFAWLDQTPHSSQFGVRCNLYTSCIFRPIFHGSRMKIRICAKLIKRAWWKSKDLGYSFPSLRMRF